MIIGSLIAWLRALPALPAVLRRSWCARKLAGPPRLRNRRRPRGAGPGCAAVLALPESRGQRSRGAVYGGAWRVRAAHDQGVLSGTAAHRTRHASSAVVPHPSLPAEPALVHHTTTLSARTTPRCVQTRPSQPASRRGARGWAPLTEPPARSNTNAARRFGCLTSAGMSGAVTQALRASIALQGACSGTSSPASSPEASSMHCRNIDCLCIMSAFHKKQLVSPVFLRQSQKPHSDPSLHQDCAAHHSKLCGVGANGTQYPHQSMNTAACDVATRHG